MLHYMTDEAKEFTTAQIKLKLGAERTPWLS
jgi:hypothetical protein